MVKHITTTIITLITSLFIVNTVSALTYSDNVNMQFTFLPTISIDISGDLKIDELAPGGYSDSNIITVTTGTNNLSGYKLSTSVGDSTNNPSTELRLSNYNANDGSNGGTNPIFTSLLTTDSYSSMGNDNISPNTWGYSYSSDNGTTWSNYSGLPIYTSSATELLNTTNIGTSSLLFKIAAKASNTQVSGTYTNIINFYITANDAPLSLYDTYKKYNKTPVHNNYFSMQDMTPEICSDAVIGSTLQVVDIRDYKVYAIAKLADDKCWMTTNLDIAGGTALSSEDTDFDSTYTLPTTNGWKVSNGKLVLPSSSTNFGPANNVARLYNSESVNCGNNSPCYSYYSWDAATLGSGRSITTGNTDTPYSICPKNWHLPNTRGGIADDTSDFRALAIVLGGSSNIANYTKNTNPTGATIYNRLIASPFKFSRGGYYNYADFSYGGNYGYYWSATNSNNGSNAYHIQFNSSVAYFAGDNVRRLGFSVRCVADYE